MNPITPDGDEQQEQWITYGPAQLLDRTGPRFGITREVVEGRYKIAAFFSRAENGCENVREEAVGMPCKSLGNRAAVAYRAINIVDGIA